MNYPVYLDNNATTPVDPRVLQAMLPTFWTHFGNPASSTHEYGWYAGELVQIAREQVAAALSADPQDIVFTSGATESSNIALQGAMSFAKSKLERSGRSAILPHAITGATEHRATLDTLRALHERGQIELTVLEVNRDGEVSIDAVQSAIRENTVLVSLMLANNEIGALHPLAAIGALTKDRGILFHCDAVQAIGKLAVDVNDLHADCLSVSAHKIYGPKGAGALYLRKSTTAGKVSPLVFGGGHEGGHRSGTLNVPGIVGLGLACELAVAELPEITASLRAHTARFIDILSESGVKFILNGPPVERRLPGNLNIYFPGVLSAKLLPALQGKIACSSSSACSSAEGLHSHVLQALGFSEERIQSSIRLGIGRFNVASEIEIAATDLAQTVRRFQTA